MQNKAVTFAALAVISISLGAQANAQLFKNARQNQQSRLADKGKASLDYVPLTRIGQAMKDRADERLFRAADRRGVSPEVLRGKRMQNLELLGAALGGAADGLGSAASNLGSSTSSTASPRNSMLPSNFSQRMYWNSYNRNYSSLPYHRGVGSN
ncbi:MAG: hypothetical protein KDB22_02955 [Planctomycetales bacterium]|nr:hypothetical protein [Planctomycetales bacterium]